MPKLVKQKAPSTMLKLGIKGCIKLILVNGKTTTNGIMEIIRP
jgi:hypothetical protein